VDRWSEPRRWYDFRVYASVLLSPGLMYMPHVFYTVICSCSKKDWGSIKVDRGLVFHIGFSLSSDISKYLRLRALLRLVNRLACLTLLSKILM
jgi:hypothetical protein